MQVSELEQLKNKEVELMQQLSGDAAPTQIKPAAAAADADNDLLSPKLNTETQSAPEKKDTTNTVKMGM